MLEWTARDGRIIQPRFYRLDKSQPWAIYKNRSLSGHLFIGVGPIVFTNIPR